MPSVANSRDVDAFGRYDDFVFVNDLRVGPNVLSVRAGNGKTSKFRVSLGKRSIVKLTGDKQMELCKGCFNGDYPVLAPVRQAKHTFEIPLSQAKEEKA